METDAPVRVAIVRIGEQQNSGNLDQIGFHIDAEVLRRAKDAMIEDRIDVVVLWVQSWGGDRSEAVRIASVLEQEYESNFRTVAWVQYAMGSAACAIWSVDKIYMMPMGSLGAPGCSWPTEPMGASDLYEWLGFLDTVSSWGRRDPNVLRSMFIVSPLSATKTGGAVRWFPDEVSGELLVNRKNELLLLSLEIAYQTGITKGIARNREGLALLLGLNNIEWVESRASDLLSSFAKIREQDTKRIQEMHSSTLRLTQRAEHLASPAWFDRESGEEALSKAKASLRSLQSALEQSPVVASHLGFEAVPSSLVPGSESERCGDIRARLEEVCRRIDGFHRSKSVP